MKPTWLIEANVEGLPSNALQAEIHRQGMDVHVVKPFLHASHPHDILGAESIPIDALVVFTGTLTLMRYIQETRRWRPGGWCTFENFSCSNYYAHLGPYLLNQNYAFLPIAEAIRRQDQLFAGYGREEQIFIRPNSVDKSFPGRLIDRDAYADFLRRNAADPTLLVMVASPKPIGYEWRLFIRQSMVVASSQYRLHGETRVAKSVPQSVIDHAEKVLSQVIWRPDPLFVMDLCESNGELSIVELNSFSCSGQCAIDLEQYVSVASESAMMYS